MVYRLQKRLLSLAVFCQPLGKRQFTKRSARFPCHLLATYNTKSYVQGGCCLNQNILTSNSNPLPSSLYAMAKKVAQ